MAEPKKAAQNNPDFTLIVVRAVPRSSKISIAQESPNQFKIRLTSAPADGAANAQLLKVLSEKLSLPARNIHLISGGTGRLKRLKIEGLGLEKIVELLTEK